MTLALILVGVVVLILGAANVAGSTSDHQTDTVPTLFLTAVIVWIALVVVAVVT